MGDVTFLRQESNKEPVVAFVGCGFGAAVYMKKVRKITDASKLAPLTSLTFFSLLRKPGRQSRPDCRLVDLCESYRRFFCGKNERVSRCGAGFACGRNKERRCGGVDRHRRKANVSSLYSVPHGKCTHFHLPKDSGVFRSPLRGSHLGETISDLSNQAQHIMKFKIPKVLS